MNRRVGVFAGVVLLILMIAASVVIANNQPEKRDNAFEREPIVSLSEQIDFSGYDVDTIIPADDNTGNIPEKVDGDRSADILIFEYADYGCSHCAGANATINRLVTEYDGRVAVVFRELVLNFPNSVSTASAATAAGIQGYWSKYKNLLFSNQAEWYYLKNDKRDAYFENLFIEASDGAGDLDKFREDYHSEAVRQRLAFNYGAADSLGIDATPHFRVNGEKVLITDLEDKLNELLTK